MSDSVNTSLKQLKRDELRNIAIIAHVDHGKTTLVECDIVTGKQIGRAHV